LLLSSRIFIDEDIGPWSRIFSALPQAGIVPASAHRSPLSDEAKAFETEMLVSPSTKAISTTSTRGASLNTGCDDVSGEFYYWDGSSWIDIYVEVDVCDDTYGDFLGWIIDNGYGDPPSVSVDASNYEITALDSVTFTAQVHGGGTYPRLGWTWVPEAGTSWDPWTTACTGNNLTCRIQVHGTGKMYFTIATPSGNIPGDMQVIGNIPDDAGDEDGDAPFVTAVDTGTMAANAITATESAQIFAFARATGEWEYTQGCAHCVTPYGNPPGPNWEPAVDRPNHKGDCTDYVWWAVRNTLGSTDWPFAKISTTDFMRPYDSTTKLAKNGFTLIDSASLRVGDVIIRGKAPRGNGHAGLFVGWAGGGYPVGYANNGSPAYPTIMRHDTTTGVYHFKVKSGYVTRFYRPILR
jgi:hypothetical protein